MSQQFVITGTDTDIGKTIFAAALVQALKARYWKPVQAGMEPPTDSQRVAQLADAGPERILAENYCLNTPASPHVAAEIDGIAIDPAQLSLPDGDGPLVIEGAGGALVPITRQWLYADQFAAWGLPVIIVARTALGTINHSLMTIEALRSRNVAIHGIAFVGDEVADSEATICQIGQVRRLGRLPLLNPLTPASLAQAFADHFTREDFA